MPSALRLLFDRLDRCNDPIGLDHLIERLRSLRIARRDLGRFARFGRDCYRRNLLHAGPHYQALAICWRSGQRSPIHDHRGSACALRVIEGVGTETTFAFSGCGLIYPTATREWSAGAVCGSFDADIHQMGNLQPAGVDLITLHVYSPPLLAMRTYFLGDAILGEDRRAVRSSIRARALRMAAPPRASDAARAARRGRARRSYAPAGSRV